MLTNGWRQKHDFNRNLNSFLYIIKTGRINICAVSLFALIMAATLFIYSKINYEQTASAGPQMAGMKFMTVWMMPIMMLMWMNNYASGLCYYYFLSQMVTIAQTYIIRLTVTDEKLRAKMVENAKKPKKKSKWQLRLEEAQRQQQAMIREQEKRQRSSKR